MYEICKRIVKHKNYDFGFGEVSHLARFCFCELSFQHGAVDKVSFCKVSCSHCESTKF